MSVDPLTISVLALLISIVALLFGTGIVFRVTNAVRSYLRQRTDEEQQIAEYLRHSAIFLEGLPHFISQTWSWGPSVPNYGARGSFPPETAFVSTKMPTVCAVVRDALALYTKHSNSQGRPYETLEDALGHLAELDKQFWKNVEVFAKSHWPIRWKTKVSQLRALQIPASEYDRIRKLRASKLGK